MKKIILTLLAIAVCAEATFDVGLLLNLLRPPAPKYHQPPPPPPPPQPSVNYYLVPVVPAQQVRHYYVQRVIPVPAHDASYYRHPVSAPVDIPHFPPLSHSDSDSVTVEAQPQPLNFTQPARNQFQQPQQSLSLPYAKSSPVFSVETAKSEGHSFTLHQEENQTSDTVEVHAEEGYN